MTYFQMKRGGNHLDTYFAPSRKESAESLKRTISDIIDSSIVQGIMQSVNGFALVLNDKRQILCANQDLLDALHAGCEDHLEGLRPGEALNCIHASKGPGGCGTSKQCRSCGAVIAMLACMKEHIPQRKECTLSMKQGSRLNVVDYSVRATPMTISGHQIMIFVLVDISAEKNREQLEHIFFHDIMNTIGGLKGWCQMLERSDDPSRIAEHIITLSERLINEVGDQQILMKAERGSLAIKSSRIPVIEIFQTLESIFYPHESANGIKLNFQMDNKMQIIRSDMSILIRILCNMIKNALEASISEEEVTITHCLKNHRLCFQVHNPSMIRPEIIPHIFKKNFSTKNKSKRGLGTYSMKLLGELYLKGSVSFTTSEKDGTVFQLMLPKEAFVEGNSTLNI